MKLEFEKLDNRYDAMDSDGSFVEWQHSTGYYRGSDPIEKPIQAQKRKYSDEIDANNKKLSIKRRRFDGSMATNVDVRAVSGIEEENIAEVTYTHVDGIDGIEETEKGNEYNDDSCLVSTRTVANDTEVPLSKCH